MAQLHKEDSFEVVYLLVYQCGHIYSRVCWLAKLSYVRKYIPDYPCYKRSDRCRACSHSTETLHIIPVTVTQAAWNLEHHVAVTRGYL